MASEAITQAKAAFRQAINLDMVRMDKVKEITKSISLSKGMSLLKDKAKAMAKETAAKALNKLGVTDTLNMAQSLVDDFGALKDDFAETFLDLTSPGSRRNNKTLCFIISCSSIKCSTSSSPASSALPCLFLTLVQVLIAWSMTFSCSPNLCPLLFEFAARLNLQISFRLLFVLELLS